MSDLIPKLVKAAFPGPIIKCLRGNANEQAVISVGVRGADGEIKHEEPWGVIAAGESHPDSGPDIWRGVDPRRGKLG